MRQDNLEIRVYYEDTDAGGIVYYANYLRFCERGRTELLRRAGFENKSLAEQRGLLFVVRRLGAQYHSPARLDDLLGLETTVSEIGNSSFTMAQRVTKDGKVLFEMDVQLVCVNENARPVRMPDDLKQILAGEGK